MTWRTQTPRWTTSMTLWHVACAPFLCVFVLCLRRRFLFFRSERCPPARACESRVLANASHLSVCAAPRSSGCAAKPNGTKRMYSDVHLRYGVGDVVNTKSW